MKSLELTGALEMSQSTRDLQNFHLRSQPPEVVIEYENVRIRPNPCMLFNGLNSNNLLG